MRSRGIQPSIAQPGSAVRVTRAATRHVTGPFPPARGGRTLDPHALDDAVPDARGDLVQQFSLQQPELGGPRRGAGADGQLAVLERDRLRVLGDVFADQACPLREDAGGRDAFVPATVADQPGDEPAERLRVARVRTRSRPTATAGVL